MGGCIHGKTAPTSSTIVEKKPIIVDSSTQKPPPLPKSDPSQTLYDHLSAEAQKNEQAQKEKLQAQKQFTLISFTKTTINDNSKKSFLELIEKNNFVSFYELAKKEGLMPHEELGHFGYYWTVIHYACQGKSAQILEYLCRLAWQNHAVDYEKIVNSQTYEGYTALIIIVQEADIELLKLFLGFGGVDIAIKDRKGKSAYNHAVSLKKKEIAEFLSSQQDFKTVNKESLGALTSQAFYEKWKNSLISQRETEISWIDSPSDEIILGSILSPNNSEIYKITAQCKDSKQNFIDPTFPHELKDFVSQKNTEKYALWSLARWLRPHELFKANYSEIQLFEDISANSIKQGSIDTCHFLSVIAGLAEYPNRVRKIFQQNGINKYGAYALNFYLNGKPKEVIIDDYFPSYQDKLMPLFAKPNGKEVWVLILEKAWCKMFGSYTVVEVEVVHEAMEDILGAPSLGIWLKTIKIDRCFELLQGWFLDKFLISATTFDVMNETYGIIPDHTYSILGVYNQNEEHGRKFIKLRNPWGSHEWKGLFQDGSEHWTEELKQLTGHFSQIEDGVFVMTLEEFFSKFMHISVCLYHDSWVYQYSEMKNPRKSGYFLLKLDKDQEINIRVHQENIKTYNVKRTKYEYKQVELILFDKSNGILAWGSLSRYVGAKSVKINDEGFISLPKGEYYIRAKVHFQNAPQKQVVVSTYSPEGIIFEDLTYAKGKGLFFESLIKMGRKIEKSLLFENQKCEMKSEWFEHLHIIYLRNSLGGNKWRVTMIVEDASNIKVGKKGRKGPPNSKEIKVEIAPNREEVFLVKKIEHYDPHKCSMKVYESIF